MTARTTHWVLAAQQLHDTRAGDICVIQSLCKLPADVQVRLPEAATMLALVRKTEDWMQRAAAAVEVERLPLKRLRDVLHAGTRLPVRHGCKWCFRPPLRDPPLVCAEFGAVQSCSQVVASF